jgi:predicted transcriptional regulator
VGGSSCFGYHDNQSYRLFIEHEALDHMQADITLENRRLIFNYILNNPGSHLRQISRDLDINLSTLRYHLDYLEKKKTITSQKDKNLKIYFASGTLNADEKILVPLLRQKRFRDIILVIIDSPGATSSQIGTTLSMDPSSASKYINLLEGRGVIYHEKVGREKKYHIFDELGIIKLLLTYKKSFWDSFVDNVLELYLER